MSKVKDFFLHKLVLRVVYITGAFSASHLAAIIMQPNIQNYINKTGLSIQVTNAEMVQAWLTGLLLIAGEFIYRLIHNKFILPVVKPK